MKRSTILAVLLLLLPTAGAQQTGNSSTPTESHTAAGTSDNTAKKSDQLVIASEQYSDAVANALLSRIAGGFTRRNPKLLLSAFDGQRFEDYRLFSERMRARLSQHQSFRAYFRILDSSLQDSRAVVGVELQIEQTSTTTARPATRSTGQARFILERGAAGWKIVDVTPRDLLTGMRGGD